MELNVGYCLVKEMVNVFFLRNVVDEVIYDDCYKKGIKEINVSFE